jgi:hypothetical protein
MHISNVAEGSMTNCSVMMQRVIASGNRIGASDARRDGTLFFLHDESLHAVRLRGAAYRRQYGGGGVRISVGGANGDTVNTLVSVQDSVFNDNQAGAQCHTGFNLKS